MSEVRTNLRVPETLYEQIKGLAEEDLRSINSEIIFLLKEAIAKRMCEAKESVTINKVPDFHDDR